MALILTVDAWWQRTDAGLKLRKRGDELTVDAEVEAWLRRHGLAADSEAVTQVVEPEPAPVEVVEEQAEPAEETSTSKAQKPAKAAPVDDWRAYAKALGIDPAGLSKSEIIAATR